MNINTKICLLVLALIIPISSASALPRFGPHLWLSTDPLNFDEAGAGYVGSSGDPWLADSYVTADQPFTLYVYHPVGNTAVDIGLLIAIHAGETGSVTVDGNVINAFPQTDISPYYSGGNHGVYSPHDGMFAVYQTDIDLLADTLSSPSMSGALPGSFTSFDISWEGFSQIHIDTFSTNGYYNPASHDATGGDDSVPEPATAVMMGGGLVCAAFIGRRFRRHRSI